MLQKQRPTESGAATTILVPPRPDPICIYCGGTVERNRGQGEHIIQAALGGRRALRERVCTRCNNNELSAIDRELCSLSFLSVVASQEIDGHLALVWDVDHTSKNLLVEARPVWDADHVLKALVAYPQITFEAHGADFRGDAEAMGRFGRENLEAVLKKAVLSAFQRYSNGQRDSIVCEHCESSALNNGYRLAPRLYAHRTIEQIAGKIDKERFYLRYANGDDKRRALDMLSKLHRQPPSAKYTQNRGSYAPTICFHYDMAKTIRALLKIGYNVLADICQSTPVDHRAFSEVVAIIRGDVSVTPGMIASLGFVRHGDAVTSIAAPNQGHGLLITHAGGLWHVYFSFFGGRMGAYVQFPGPCRESWSTMRVFAPLKSRDWFFVPSDLVQVMKVNIEGCQSKLICPSLQIRNTVSEVQVSHRYRPRKHPMMKDRAGNG